MLKAECFWIDFCMCVDFFLCFFAWHITVGYLFKYQATVYYSIHSFTRLDFPKQQPQHRELPPPPKCFQINWYPVTTQDIAEPIFRGHN